jgi:prepilin signal peptidase PulO-like enzyme (type II secretory pathway)
LSSIQFIERIIVGFFGDIWLLAALGLWTGPWGDAIVFILAAWLGVGFAAYEYIFQARQVAVLPIGVLLGISFITYIIAGLLDTLLRHNIL